VNELTSDMNWSAVVTGAALSYLVGWLWYSKRLFGLRWARATNMDYTDQPPVAALAMHFGGMVLLSWFVGVMAQADMLAATMLLTIAIAVLGYATDGFLKIRTDGKLINSGYWIVMIAIMVAAQALVPAA